MFEQVKPFSPAARTATPTPVRVDIPEGARYLEVSINVTAINLTPSVVFNIEVETGDGTWVSFLATAAMTAVSAARLRIGPDVATTANVSAPIVPPRAVRIAPVHADADSITYSVVCWMR